MARMRTRVVTARDGLTAWLAGTERLSVIHGWGRFDGREADGRLRVMVGLGSDEAVDDERIVRFILDMARRAFGVEP